MSIRMGRLIIKDECDSAGITLEELVEGPRTRSYTLVRHTLIKRLREEAGLSWKEVGIMVGYNSRPSKQGHKLGVKRSKLGVIHTTTTTT